MRKAIDDFVRRQNIESLNKQLGYTTDEIRRKMLLTLLAEEAVKANDARPSTPFI